MEFLDLLERNPAALTELTIAEYAKRGGVEGAEIVMWLVMRGALSARVKKIHQTYYLPSMTAIATVIYESDSLEPDTETADQYTQRIGREWKGIGDIEGSYPYTLDRSVKAFRINSFLHRLIEPQYRSAFLDHPEPMFRDAKLSDVEADLIRRRDWRGLIQYGVSFFLLEKLGAVIGTTNLHIYAAMRGQSLEDFQKTRNAQVLYSVAGQPAKDTNP